MEVSGVTRLWRQHNSTLFGAEADCNVQCHKQYLSVLKPFLSLDYHCLLQYLLKQSLRHAI